MTGAKVSKYFFGLVFLSIFSFCLLSILGSGRSFAVTGLITNEGPSDGSSTNPNGRAWYAVGRGGCSSAGCSDGFNGRTMAIQLYSTTKQMNVNLVSAGAGCGPEDSNRVAASGDTLYEFYDGVDTTLLRRIVAQNDGSNCSPYNITIVANQVHGSTYNNKPLYYATLWVQLRTTVDYMENSFRVNITSNTSESFVSFVRDNQYNDFTGIYRRDMLSGDWDHTMVFAPPCSNPSQLIQGEIKWFDADVREYNPNLTIVLQVADKGGSNWSDVRNWSGSSQIGNTGETRTFTYNFSTSKQYKLVWRNISWINTIQIQLPFAQINAKADPCPDKKPICTNDPYTYIVTLQQLLDSGLDKSNGINTTPGICYPRNNTSNGCSFDQVSGQGVQLNSPFSFKVRARNGGNTVWDKTNTRTGVWHIPAYITQDNPSPWAPGSIVASFGAGNTLPALSQGQTSAFVPTHAVDTSTPGQKVYNFYLVWLDIGQSNPNYSFIEGDANRPACTMVVNVLPPPPTGNIIYSGCDQVSFNVGWSAPWSSAPAVHYRIKVANQGYEGDANGTVSLGTFNQINTTDPLHYSSYDVSLELRDASGSWSTIYGPPVIGSCLSDVVCNGSPEWEFDKKTQYTFTASINNTSRRTDGNYSIVISPNPPGGSKSPISPGTTTYNGSFQPDQSMTIVASLYYRGSQVTSINEGKCPITVNRYPYIKAYGGSVISGGSFKPNCTTNLGGIFTRMRAIGSQPGMNESGSGSQLISLSNTINGFASGTIGNGNPNPVPGQYLSPGGRASIPGGSTQQLMAQNYNTSNYCLPDYWGMQYDDTTKKVTMTNTGVSQISGDEGGADNIQVLYPATYPFVQIPASGLKPYKKHKTYFIDRDLVINGNVEYHDASADPTYGLASNVPNFTIVVRGNIYISSSVSRLDGIYIAVEDQTTNVGGKVYTCAQSGGVPYTINSQIYANCRSGYGDGDTTSPLTINGALIAKSAVFNRAVNTIADSVYKEGPNNTKASEVFNFGPEVYISPPIFNTDTANGRYDSVGILPPIL